MKMEKEMAGTSIAQASVAVQDVARGTSVREQQSHPQQTGYAQTMDWGSDCTDEQLILACQRGREEALDVLYQRYYRPVLAFIYRLVQDRQLAEDLVQETFLRVYNNRLSWKPKSKFTSWLYRIARNLCIDEKRRYWNRLVAMDSQFTDKDNENSASYLDRVRDTKADAREYCARGIDESAIKQAINQLSEEQREVILMNKYQGLTYIEISEILGVSPESIKQRAYRAHLKLRELLEPMLGEY
ncbi:sigma-70 family RNA polymerase sigma factor [bacterium]|nr:sigma-70 family RNA polymerase sigma factor [bacterium]